MWWLIVPVALGIGKAIHSAVTRETHVVSFPPKSILVQNLYRLRASTLHSHPRRVALLGQPGAGKSTILKKLSKGKARPAPVIGTQTDATNWSDSTDVTLFSEWDGHLVSDVPGYDTASHPVAVFIENFPFANFAQILLIVNGKVRGADVEMYHRIVASATPVLVVRSHADALTESERRAVRADLHKQFPKLARKSLVFVSSRSGEGIEGLRAIL
jgi:GTP-binding protein EngB required for normal cell division